jgi:DNA-directed RNA polymerase subunit M/transcription elongation factor TFIIS
MWEETLKCPKCGSVLEVDSIREHRNGTKRIYWECKKCNISIMFRNK